MNISVQNLRARGAFTPKYTFHAEIYKSVLNTVG